MRSTLVVAVLVMLSTVLAPAFAARAAAPDLATRMFVARVTASEKATPAGTQVTTSFRVNNRTGKPVKAGRATTFLVSTTGTATRLGTVLVPRIKPGQKKFVRATAVAPDLAAGNYSVRVCLSPYPGAGACARTTGRPVTITPAVLTATPAAVTFASAPILTRGAPAPETTAVVVRNTGQALSGQLTTTLTGPDAAQFTVVDNTCSASLGLGDQCSLQVARPDAGAPLTATLTVLGTDGASVAVPLSVDAAPTADLYLTPTSADFGNVAVGTIAQVTFEVVNNAGADQNLVGQGGTFRDGLAYFFDHSGPFTCATGRVPANSSCTITVGFQPQTTGLINDVMTIYGPDGLMTADLTGSGIACRACRAPATTAPELRSTF